MNTRSFLLAAGFGLALLLTLPYSAYAAAQSNFYGVWVRGNDYYEINNSSITKTETYSNDYKKAKYRIVKWEKSGNNGYVIYTLSENNNKISFSVKIDVYSDVFIGGYQMKKSSSAELNKAIRSIESVKAAEKKATEQIVAKATANAAKLASLQSSFSDSRDGKNYKTAKIGDQIWMAENLNFETEDSRCYGNKPSNCDIYGRLYNWNTAMKACPNGWHLPTNAEWDKLYRYVDGDSSTKSPYESKVAGKYLKAKSGWKGDGNGTDSYGFAALPGGYGSDGSFNDAGGNGYWWSASEDNASSAYSRYMWYESERAYLLYSDKSALPSIRCLQD